MEESSLNFQMVVWLALLARIIKFLILNFRNAYVRKDMSKKIKNVYKLELFVISKIFIQTGPATSL